MLNLNVCLDVWPMNTITSIKISIESINKMHTWHEAVGGRYLSLLHNRRRLWTFHAKSIMNTYVFQSVFSGGLSKLKK